MHFKKVYSCGHLLAQCRCAEEKSVIVIPDPCPNCGREAVAENAALKARAEKPEVENERLMADLVKTIDAREFWWGRAEKAEAGFAAADKEIAELEAEAVALKADLARAVEERDAALLLLKTLGAEHGRAWLSTASEAAFNLLRERGLLGGERG